MEPKARRAVVEVMRTDWNRRDFLNLVGIGGVVFASALPGCGPSTGKPPSSGPRPVPGSPADDFFFLQLSDTHWGFEGPPNPHADVTLERAVATINAVDIQPDFVVFTGDLTHTTDDPGERRDRMARFREIASGLKVRDLRFLPGEHDAGPDHGEAYRCAFGDVSYSFDHKGVHFVALDNVSRGGAGFGDEQLAWLAADLAAIPEDAPLVIFAHRPLFDLYPEWDWMTKDGAQAIEIISRRHNATVFYGHIHQEHHRTIGRTVHHSARSLMFPLPAPGSVAKKTPLVWDPASADHGLGFRRIAMDRAAARITEIRYTGV